MRLLELIWFVNILLLGIKVLILDLKEYFQDDDLGYYVLVNFFKGLFDIIFMVRFDFKNQKLILFFIFRDI